MDKRTYFAHIDLLRVFFVTVVLLHHWVAKNPFAFLPFGSTIAFVLSGFLLTTPLLKAKKDKPNYWKVTLNFLARRLLRTLPIYLLLLSVYYILDRHDFRSYVVYFLTFTQNYLMVYSPAETIIGFGQTWSLAIQEQFYFFLPIVVYLVPYKYLSTLFIAFSIAGLLFRLWYFYLGLPFIYNHFTTECCIDCLGIGALISYYHYEHSDKFKKVLSNKLLLGVLILAYLCSTLGYSNHIVNIADKGATLFNNLYRITERTFVSLLSVWFIGWGIYYPSQRLHKISSNFAINYLSKISYGIYIYHFFVAGVILKTLEYLFNFAPKNIQFAWWVICLNFSLTILMSIFSYELIEKPILKFKDDYFGDLDRQKPSNISNLYRKIIRKEGF